MLPPKDCDWMPITNPLYFVFCIVLKVLAPVMSPPVFLQVGASLGAARGGEGVLEREGREDG